MTLRIDGTHSPIANDSDHDSIGPARANAVASYAADAVEAVAANGVPTRDLSVKADVAAIAGSEHVSPKTARFIKTVTQQPLDAKAARDEFLKLTKSEREDALAVLLQRDPKAAAGFGAALAERTVNGKFDDWDDAYTEYWSAADKGMESLAARGVHRLEPFIDEVTLLAGDGGTYVKERALSKVEQLADDAYLYKAHDQTLSAVSNKLDQYKAQLGGDWEAGMLAMARRDPVGFGKAMAQLIKIDDGLYAQIRDKALALPPGQLNTLVTTMAAERDPSLAGVKADLAHGLLEKAPGAPNGPLSPSHHRQGPTGPTRQQYAGWGVALLSDPAAARYSADFFLDKFERDLSYLIKTDRAEAEQWIIGLVEANAKIYAHHLTSGDLDKAKAAAHNIGILIGKTEKAVRATLKNPKDQITMLSNILEGTTKVVGLIFPAKKALTTAFEAGMKFGKAAFKSNWSEDEILDEFAKRMLGITVAAYQDVTDPTGSKMASRSERYGAEVQEFLNEVVAAYNDSRDTVAIGIFSE